MPDKTTMQVMVAAPHMGKQIPILAVSQKMWVAFAIVAALTLWRGACLANSFWFRQTAVWLDSCGGLREFLQVLYIIHPSLCPGKYSYSRRPNPSRNSRIKGVESL
jgi:hypothetical protein